MLRLLNLLTLRSLGTHLLRTLLSTFGIVLGVATILAIGIINLAAMDSITRLFQNTSGRTSLMIVNAEETDKSIPASLLKRVASQPGVEMAVPVVQIQTALADDVPSNTLNLSFFGASVQGLSLYGINPALDTAVRDYQLYDGRFLSSNLKTDEIVLVRDYAVEKKLSIGHKVAIVTPTGVQRLTLVGLINKDGAGQVNNGAFGVIPLNLAQTLFDRKDQLDRIDIVAGSEYATVDALDSLKESVQELLGSKYSVIYPSSQGKRMTQMLVSYQIGLNFMSGMALFVGAFLIYNAFSMTVVERKREFGMLRTIGMTSFQVTGLVLAEALLLGLIGAGLGVGLGLIMSFGLARIMELILGQTLTVNQIPMDVLLTSISVGVVTTLLAAFIPALQAGRISPLEALRARGQTRPGWLLRYGWILGILLLILAVAILIQNPFSYDVQFRLGSLTVFALFTGAALIIPAILGISEFITRPIFQFLYGSSGRLGSSNLQREKLRTTLTVGALMVGVSMTLVTQSLTESLKSDLLDWINAYIGGDLYVSSTVTLPKDFSHRLETIEGVEAAVPLRYLETQLIKSDDSADAMTFMAVDPTAYTRVTNFVFSDSQTDQDAALASLAQGDAVFISSVIAERYGLAPGSFVRLRTAEGPRNFEVAAVIVDFYNQGLVITGSWKDLLRYFKISDASTVLVKLGPSYLSEDVHEHINAIYGKRYNLSIISNQSIKDNINTLMGQAFSMFDVLALIAIIVASLGVVNTLTMNVLERLKEIGMLRSIGMTRSQVAGMVLAEAGMMGLIGGALGLVFGLLLTRIFLAAMMAMSGYMLTYTLPTTGLIITLAIAVVISQVSAILPAWRAARVAILEAIHYE